MKTLVLRALGILLALAFHAPLQAAINCTISSPGFATAYFPTAPSANVTQTYFTVTCTRGSAADPMSVSYDVRADNGSNSLGINNRAASGGSFIRYDLYRNASCGSQWKGAADISSTITFSGTGTVSRQSSYWGCVAAGQTGLPAGTYVDNVTMTLSYGPMPQSTATGAFGVSISTPATCSITMAPGPLVFDYLAFGPAIAPSTAFGVTCTNALPYTMALDVASGTLLGLAYTLSLSTASSTGTGAQQGHTVNGAMAAGQAGTCAVGTCSASQPHAIIITY